MTSILTLSSILTLTGASGDDYEFGVYALDGRFPPLGVVFYVFGQAISAKSPAARTAVYVGQTGDASICIDEFHRTCFVAHGATHVALHLDPRQQSRLRKVEDLVRALQPVCNA